MSGQRRLLAHGLRLGRLFGVSLRRAMAHYRAQQGGLWAGALSFISILALVPLLTVVITVLSAYPNLSRASKFMRDYIESELLPNTSSKVITKYLFNFIENADKLGILGMAFLALTALLLLNRLEAALNHLWGIRAPRRFHERFKNYWFVLTIGPIAVGTIFYLMSESLSVSFGWFGFAQSLFHSLMVKGLSFFLLIALFFFAFAALPNRPTSWRISMLAAFIATMALALLQKAFEIYLATFPSFTLIYGTFATVPIFLVWVYVCWQMFLICACLHIVWEKGEEEKAIPALAPLRDLLEPLLRMLAVLWHGYRFGINPNAGNAQTASAPPAQPPSRVRLVLRFLYRTLRVKSRRDAASQSSHSVDHLAAQCGLTPWVARHWLTVFAQQGWVSAHRQQGVEVWYLVRDPASITQADWHAVILGDAPQRDDNASLITLLNQPNLAQVLQTIAHP